jgi:hypothetical protein
MVMAIMTKQGGGGGKMMMTDDQGIFLPPIWGTYI